MGRDYHILKNLRLENFKPQDAVGLNRDAALEAASFESCYGDEGKEIQEQLKVEQEKSHKKSMIKFFGYKHNKSLRFYAQLLKCLRDCFEARYESLNINLNFLMILKNELQTPYLKKAETLAVTMKKASAKYPMDEDVESLTDESQEMKILEKILNN